VTDDAKDYLAKEGFDEAYGARPLRRAIQSKVEDKLAEELLDNKIKYSDKVIVDIQEDKLHFSVE
jgi:ATP-dependent Clp protease ATP-binding subunit ClpC